MGRGRRQSETLDGNSPPREGLPPGESPTLGEAPARADQPARGQAPSRRDPKQQRRAPSQKDAGDPTDRERPPSDARSVALRVLDRVVREGAYAAPALDGELRRATLASRDAALTTTLVYGVLRKLPSLDAALAPQMRRAPDPWVALVLRIAAYQLLYLERIPAYAAVDAAVSTVRRERGRGPAGFVNAVLRALTRAEERRGTSTPDIDLPEWLLAALARCVGPARALAFTTGIPLPPPIDLRVTRGSRDAFLARLHEERPDLEVHAVGSSPLALRTFGAGDPRQLPGYEEGAFVVQELGSQRIVDLVQAAKGDRVLDACAGRGGKTLALAALLDPGRVTAVDLHEARLEQIAAEATRLGIDPAKVDAKAIDLSVGTADLVEQDRVLVDAPCTGLGTVHRRPEILLRVGPDDPARLGTLQTAILANASRLVRPGGLLVYAVCSPLDAEGIDVVHAFEAQHPAFERIALPATIDASEHEADLGLRMGPWLAEPTDGYQVFRWKRV